ncbi:HIT family protein [Candidatus Woesearchaeota archaeon]|nr:HIT family protein [Candidatus Woesearchaeota archaeon]
MEKCMFCTLTKPVLSNSLFYAVYDGNPVQDGHMLVIPKRHVNSVSELSDAEAIAMLDLMRKAKEHIRQNFNSNDFNHGINDGAAAGQTVPHLHIHIIPRYNGDIDDPTGGVRNIIPGKGNYLKKIHL